MPPNESAVELFKRRRALGSTSVLIFYRGERSFFCRQWLRRWLSIPALERRLRLMDVALIFTSSQSQGKALCVAEQIAGPSQPLLDDRIFFFGDPQHLLVDYLVDQNLSSPVITNPDSHRAHGWIFDYGMVQPAIVAVASDSAVVYEWTARPSILNVAGKLDRPDPWDVWDRIERRLDRIRISNQSQDHTHPQPTVDALPTPPLPRPSSRQAVLQSPSPSLPRAPSRRAALQSPFVPFDADTDAPNGPLSTSVDTLVVDSARDATVLREDLDISQTNLIGNIRVQDLSARIHALARDLIAEDALNGNADESSPNVISSNEPPTSSTTDATENSTRSNGNNISEVEIAPKTPSHIGINASSQLPQLASMLISMPTSISESFAAFRDDCEEKRAGVTIIEDDVHGSGDTLEDEDNFIDDENDDVVGELDAASNADQSEFSDRIVSPPNLDGDENDSVPGELELSFIGDVHSDSLRPGSTNIPLVNRRLDLFERQSSTTEPLEASVASIGSDQVDSTTVITKHVSMAADDSVSHPPFELAPYSSDRRIQEEADDRETGISDYLKELKDPNLIHSRLSSSSTYRRPGHVSIDRDSRQTNNIKSENSNFKPPVMVDQTGQSEKPGTSGSRSPFPESPTLLVDDYLSEKATSSQHNQQHLLRASSQTPAPSRNMNQLKITAPNVDAGRGTKAPSRDTFKDLATSSLASNIASPYRETRQFDYTGISNAKKKPIFPETTPFADADNDINEPHESPVVLRDEYEAYDEYIVCEYEVEEHVEEYESDGMSRSRGFVTNSNDPYQPLQNTHYPASRTGTHGILPNTSSATDPQHHLNQHYHHHLHRATSATAGRICNTRARGYGRTETAQADQHDRVNGNTLAAMASAPTLRPCVDTRALEWPHVRAAAAGVAPQRRNVRTVLRKIRLPIMSSRRRRAEREKEEEAARSQRDKDGLADNETISSRFKCKDTLRSVPVPRKRPPTGARNSTTPSGTSPIRRPLGVGTEGTRMGVDNPGATDDAYSRASRRNSEVRDERCARVGRKDTLRTVFRKIPMPKSRRRASTGEAQQQQQQQTHQQKQEPQPNQLHAPNPSPNQAPGEAQLHSQPEAESQQQPTQRQSPRSRRNRSATNPFRSTMAKRGMAQAKVERETGALAATADKKNTHSQIAVRRFPSLSSYSYDNHSAANANNHANVTVSPQERRNASLRLSMDNKRNIDMNMNMDVDVNMQIPKVEPGNRADVNDRRSSVRSRRSSLRSGLNIASGGKKKKGFGNEGLNDTSKKRTEISMQNQDLDRSAASVVHNSTTVSETRGPESPELRDDSLLHRHAYDGDVWVARLDDGLQSHANANAPMDPGVISKLNNPSVNSSSSSGARADMKRVNIVSATSSSLSGRRGGKKWRRRGHGRGVGGMGPGTGTSVGNDGSSTSAYSVMGMGLGSRDKSSVMRRLKTRATDVRRGGAERSHEEDEEMDLVRLRNELEPYGTPTSVVRDTDLSAVHSDWYGRGGHASSTNDTGSEREGDRYRWGRWKRRDEGGAQSDNDAMTAEKVGPKMSFQSVSERIFSTFKL